MQVEKTTAEALAQQIDEIRDFNRRLELENAELSLIVTDRTDLQGHVDRLTTELAAACEELSARTAEAEALRVQLASLRYRLVDKVLRPLERHPRLGGTVKKGVRGARRLGSPAGRS